MEDISPLLAFGPGLWLSDGPEVSVAGFHYPTRMAVIRLQSGGLFIWSPIRLSPALHDAIAALGPVRHIVAPNRMHHLFLPEWHAAFPEAMLHAAPGLRRKRRDIAFDAYLTNTPHPDWQGEIGQQLIAGNLIATEAVFFHRPSGTVLFTDLLQQIAPARLPGWRGTIARLDLMAGPEPAVPRKFRLAFTNRAAARASLRHVLSWPCEKVVMAHGTPVTSDAPAFLARAFRWLF